jgi:hypothetical protein
MAAGLVGRLVALGQRAPAPRVKGNTMNKSDTELRHDVESNVRERGRRDLKRDLPHATDQQLWELAAGIMPGRYGLWVDALVAAGLDSDAGAGMADALAELREWYDEDRRTSQVDMGQLATALSLLGVCAHVHYDCGGQWLLHVGPAFVDAEGVEIPAVTFGGDQTVPDQSGSTVWCSTEGMSAGTGDRSVPDAEQIQESIAEKPWRVADLAKVIAGVLDRELERRGYTAEAWDEHHEIRRARVIDARIAAEQAFGAVLKAKFPELTGGDEEPGIAMMLEQSLERAIDSLLDGNTPDLPWAAGTEPIEVEPPAELKAHAAELAQRAQQVAGRTLRPWSGARPTLDDLRRELAGLDGDALVILLGLEAARAYRRRPASPCSPS